MAALPFGRPQVIDPDYFASESDESALSYENWLATGAPVWPDVALAVWNAGGDGDASDPQTEYIFTARAMKWGLEADGTPKVDFGDAVNGVTESELPANPSAPGGSPGMRAWREVGVLANCGAGWTYLGSQQNNGNQPYFGQFIHAGEDLTVTLGAQVLDPSSTRTPDGWINSVIYGASRVTIVSEYNNWAGGEDTGQAWVSIPVSTGAQPEPTLSFVRHSTSGYTALWESGDYAHWADMGYYWIGIAVPFVDGVQRLEVHTFPDAGGHPDFTAAPEVRLSQDRGDGWDFDATFMIPQANGKIFIYENYSNVRTNCRMWVLDPNDWVLTGPVYGPDVWADYAGGLEAYASFTPMSADLNPGVGDHDNVALWSVATRFASTPEGAEGFYVGAFDGAKTIDSQEVFHYERNVYGDNPLYSYYNCESFYLGGGKVVTIALTEDRSDPRPGSNPVTPPQRWATAVAIASYLPSFYDTVIPVPTLTLSLDGTRTRFTG